MIDIKSRYFAAHLLWMQQNRPNVVKDGFYTRPKFPDITRTNGITDYCVNMINWLGGDAKRVNVVTRASDKKVMSESGQGYFMDKRYTKSVKKNTADILSVIRGRSIDIEVKNKYTGDKMREGQWLEKSRRERAGGLYWVVTCVEDFLTELDGFLYGQ